MSNVLNNNYNGFQYCFLLAYQVPLVIFSVMFMYFVFLFTIALLTQNCSL